MTRKTDLILRTCDANLQSHEGFQYPTEGWVEAPDWDPTDKCGGGIHGLFKGVGNGSLLSTELDAKWLVLEAYSDEVVEITEHGGGKCKVPRARVAYVGDKQTAVQMVADRYPELPVAFAIRSVGDGGTSTSCYRGTSTSGDRGTSTSGNYGTSTSGNYGTSTSGHGGTSTSGDYGTSTSGEGGTSTSGHGGTSTSGDRGTSTSGNYGTSTSGNGGTSTSGHGGTSTSGDYGTSTSGEGSKARSGINGEIRIRWYDGQRYRLAVGYIGEDGLEPNVFYRVENGKFVRA